MEPGDRRTDGVDGPADLVADDAGRFGRIRIQPEPGEDVGEVDAGRPHTDPHFTSGRRRIRPLPHFQHVRRSVPGYDDLAHGTAKGSTGGAGSRFAGSGVRGSSADSPTADG